MATSLSSKRGADGWQQPFFASFWPSSSSTIWWTWLWPSAWVILGMIKTAEIPSSPANWPRRSLSRHLSSTFSRMYSSLLVRMEIIGRWLRFASQSWPWGMGFWRWWRWCLLQSSPWRNSPTVWRPSCGSAQTKPWGQQALRWCSLPTPDPTGWHWWHWPRWWHVQCTLGHWGTGGEAPGWNFWSDMDLVPLLEPTWSQHFCGLTNFRWQRREVWSPGGWRWPHVPCWPIFWPRPTVATLQSMRFLAW